jgi:hypothetical protein
VLQRTQVFRDVGPTRVTHNYRRFEGTCCLDLQGPSILCLSDPKKLPHIGIDLPNDTESHPTELNPNVRVRSELYCIGKTSVENYCTVMSSTKLRHLIGHYIKTNERVSEVVLLQTTPVNMMCHMNTSLPSLCIFQTTPLNMMCHMNTSFPSLCIVSNNTAKHDVSHEHQFPFLMYCSKQHR